MTPAEVRERKAALEHIGRELKRQQDHLAVEYKHLQLDCGHPDIKCYNSYGDSCSRCPDCGLST